MAVAAPACGTRLSSWPAYAAAVKRGQMLGQPTWPSWRWRLRGLGRQGLYPGGHALQFCGVYASHNNTWIGGTGSDARQASMQMRDATLVAVLVFFCARCVRASCRTCLWSAQYSAPFASDDLPLIQAFCTPACKHGAQRGQHSATAVAPANSPLFTCPVVAR